MGSYPSTQVLAAFRRSIGVPIDGEPFDGGAFLYERTHGIGWRVPTGMPWDMPASHARREASAMRSRAFGKGGF